MSVLHLVSGIPNIPEPARRTTELNTGHDRYATARGCPRRPKGGANRKEDLCQRQAREVTFSPTFFLLFSFQERHVGLRVSAQVVPLAQRAGRGGHMAVEAAERRGGGGSRAESRAERRGAPAPPCAPPDGAWGRGRAWGREFRPSALHSPYWGDGGLKVSPAGPMKWKEDDPKVRIGCSPHLGHPRVRESSRVLGHAPILFRFASNLGH